MTEPGGPGLLIGRIGISPNRPSFRLGGLRTHLAAAAFLAHLAGSRSVEPRLLLRIDDTNERLARASAEPLLAELRDVGRVPVDRLGQDGSAWLLRQSSRTARYRSAVEQLAIRGLVRIDLDGSAIVEMRDGVLVPVAQRPGRSDSPVRILRSGGTPLWHLASSVDDIDAQVGLCLRAVDKRAAEPIQRALITALGGIPPAYYYLPKMRYGDRPVSVAELLRSGSRPSAIFGYLASTLVTEGSAPRTFGELAERIKVRSDLRSSFAYDEIRLKKVERQVSVVLTPAEMSADLRRMAEFRGDSEVLHYAGRHPVEDLLAGYRRSLDDQYTLVGRLTRRTFATADPAIRAQARRIAPLLADEAGTSVVPAWRAGELSGVVRWMLGGDRSGPPVDLLWRWHRRAGTLTEQIASAVAATEQGAGE